MITTLLLKTHKVTGLRYFCKTVNEGKARDRYRGSGIRWRNHIMKHGGGNKFVTTEIVAEYDWYNLFFEEEISTFALNWSSVNNIVDDPGYANLEPENGLDGAIPGHKHSAETRAKRNATNAKKTPEQKAEIVLKISASLTGLPSWSKGKKLSPETCDKRKGNTNGKGNKGKKRSLETVAKIGKSLTGRPSPLKGKKRTPESIAKGIETNAKKKALKDHVFTATA